MALLLFFHLAQKQKYSQKGCPCRIAQNPWQMRKEGAMILIQQAAFQLHGMDKRQGIRNALKGAAYQIEIKPGAR